MTSRAGAPRDQERRQRHRVRRRGRGSADQRHARLPPVATASATHPNPHTLPLTPPYPWPQPQARRPSSLPTRRASMALRSRTRWRAERGGAPRRRPASQQQSLAASACCRARVMLCACLWCEVLPPLRRRRASLWLLHTRLAIPHRLLLSFAGASTRKGRPHPPHLAHRPSASRSPETVPRVARFRRR